MTTKRILTGIAAAACLTLSASAAYATTKIVNLGVIDTPTTLTGSFAYTTNEKVEFKFTVDAPYSFTFMDTGSGGSFPFPISTTATGGAGVYTETFGEFPVHGTLDYTLTTTTVPEPATWALMLVGLGAIGLGVRRSKQRDLRTA